MKQLAVPVLVSRNALRIYEVTMPTVGPSTFTGASLARLLDDAAVMLMETVPKSSAADMRRYELCPWVMLRKIIVDVEVPKARRHTERWKGRMTCVVRTWPRDDFYIITPVRLPQIEFAVRHLAGLDEALSAVLAAYAEEEELDGFDGFASRPHEHLEILGFETDLPSILPSQPKRKKKKKKKKGEKRKKSKKSKSQKTKDRRRLVTPTELRQVGDNLTHRALDDRLGRAYLRESLVEDVLRQLAQPGSGILLVGPSGVGKTAIVHEVVRRLAAQATGIRDRQDVWQVDGNRIIAGMSVVGAWERRVHNIVNELEARQDVLYVDDLPALVHTGRSAHADTNVADFMEPLLARGELRIIGECTPERLLATKDEAPGFFSRFRIITVDGMNEHDTLLVLVNMLRDVGHTNMVTANPEALEAVMGLVRRFEVARENPGKSVALFSRVLADHTDITRDDFGRRRIERKQVVDFYGRQAGLPSFVLWEEEARPLEEVERFFSERIIAQPAAVEAASDVVALLEQGLNDPERPLATFLFVGPTGVGKTETAKALADFLFGAKERMLRFDMSELMSAESVARLIGDRFRPDGELTRRVQQQPFSVVLFDEIEKAHPAIFDALLQVLGEGRLTNAAGRTVDFKNTIIIMTSNLGVRDAQKRLGFDRRTTEAYDAHYVAAAERFFRPEFFNRIDRVVPFGYLGRDAIVPLVERMLQQMLSRRGLLRSGVIVDVEPELVDILVSRGFDERYGARSVRRILEHELAVPLAEHLVRRHRDRLTFVELFARNGEIDMSVELPEDRTQNDGHEHLPPDRWAEVDRRLLRVAHLVERLATSTSTAAVADEHTGLLERFNRGERTPELQAQLTAIGSLLDGLRELREQIEHFAEQHIEKDELEFQDWLVRADDLPHYETRVRREEIFTPTRGFRGALRDDVKAAVVELELDAAALFFRVEATQRGDTEPVLLRLRPATGHMRKADALRDMSVLLGRAWAGRRRPFATARLFEHLDDWAEVDGHDRARTPTAIGLELSGPGVADVVEHELGYHLPVSTVGPDRHLDLLRLERVGGTGDVLERLRAFDAAEHSARERRRANEGPWRPALPLVRVFGPGAETLGGRSSFTYRDLAMTALLRIYREAEARGGE